MPVHSESDPDKKYIHTLHPSGRALSGMFFHVCASPPAMGKAAGKMGSGASVHLHRCDYVATHAALQKLDTCIRPICFHTGSKIVHRKNKKCDCIHLSFPQCGHTQSIASIPSGGKTVWFHQLL